VLTALDPMDMPMLTALDPAERMPMLMALDPRDGMAFLTASARGHNPTEGLPVAFLTSPDPAAGPVEVGRPSVAGSTEHDLDPCPNYHVRAAVWNRLAAVVTRTGPETSETRIPTSRTSAQEESTRPIRSST
jgi:hypothetical protein